MHLQSSSSCVLKLPRLQVSTLGGFHCSAQGNLLKNVIWFWRYYVKKIEIKKRTVQSFENWRWKFKNKKNSIIGGILTASTMWVPGRIDFFLKRRFIGNQECYLSLPCVQRVISINFLLAILNFCITNAKSVPNEPMQMTGQQVQIAQLSFDPLNLYQQNEPPNEQKCLFVCLLLWSAAWDWCPSRRKE